MYFELDPTNFEHARIIPVARKAARYYIDALHELNDWLHNYKGEIREGLYQVDKDPITGPFAEVIICGFVL